VESDVQYFMTTQGIARRDGESLHLVDTTMTDLHQAIVDGGLEALAQAPVRDTIALEDATLLAPVRPARLGQVGLNYRSHLEEVGAPEPERMIYTVSDCSGAIGGPDTVIYFPEDAPDKVDHECEIALVIGRRASKVAVEDAWSVIAGITACNDVSARDIQREGIAKGDFGAGKMLPGFKPLGPGLMTSDEVSGGPITISLSVNGVERQRADSSEMVFSIADVIATITAEHTLEPGDVVITGSPAGVGAFAGRFLVDGDVVEVTVADLPPLRNTFQRRA
jgi:2-keto-4-pentenoate hydratase/2-oxohepta-3-ene-1,7-dioic acid hydratase in catechol pathway